MWTSDFCWYVWACYILTEASRSLKTFLKENYAIALDSVVTYLLKNVKQEELNMVLIVLIYTFLKFTGDLMMNLKVC